MSARGDRHAAPQTPVVPAGPSAVDLHTHTLRSDGVLQPEALVEQASAAGVRLLAITDHDNLAAYRELSAPGAAPLPARLQLIPGVEINCLMGGQPDVFEGELHILEEAWRAAEEIAGIADSIFMPASIDEDLERLKKRRDS